MNLPQSFFGTTDATSSAKVGDATNAEDDKDQMQEESVPVAAQAAEADRSGQPTSSVAVPERERPCEDPYGLPTGIKKEEE